MRLNTDSFVVESNVHFPTDYNLLWDSGRKCMDIMGKSIRKYKHVTGWRKLGYWYRRLKSKMRGLGQVGKSGGKGKEERLLQAATDYLYGYPYKGYAHFKRYVGLGVLHFTCFGCPMLPKKNPIHIACFFGKHLPFHTFGLWLNHS